MVSSLIMTVKEIPMKKRFSEEQIIRILRETDAQNIPILDLC